MWQSHMKSFTKHQLALVLGYLALITLLRWSWEFDLVWLWLGGLAGFYFVYLDRLMYALIVKPEEQLSLHIKHLIRHGRYLDIPRLLKARGNEQTHLLTRSALFMVVWVPLAIFVISSTTSQFAAAMMMTIALRLILDILTGWHDLASVSRWLFWQIKRPVSATETKGVVSIFIVLWALITWWLV